MTVLRVATRASRLARAQTALVVEALRAATPALRVEVVEVQSEGDADRQTPLRVLGGRGVFVRAVEQALLDGRADVAVHSLKDVPTEQPEDLTLAAVPRRGDPRDALCAAPGRTLRDLPAGARVGTSSRRRAALLAALRPDLLVTEVRGNVDTRLGRVAAGDLDAVVLAVAGLQRLDRLGEATQLFEAMEFLPAPGQGALVAQCRTADAEMRERLAALDHGPTRGAVTAERGFLAALGSGCSLPVGAYAQVSGDLLTLRAMIAAEPRPQDPAAAAGGAETAPPGETPLPTFGDAVGPAADAERLGRELGAQLRAAVAPPPA